jgi:hypothetical protein
MLMLPLLAIPARPQGAQTKERSPRTVMEEFWKLEIEGGRLTAEGWRRANTFFVRPMPVPASKEVIVIDRDFSVWDPIINGNNAQVMIGIRSLGTIDSSLQYLPPNSDAVKEGVGYHLLLSDKHWEFGGDGTTLKEVTGVPEWRIDHTGTKIFLTVETARRYISEARDKTTDSLIKRNADRALAALNRDR